MSKKIIAILIITVSFLSACKKENAELKPSDKDINWFTVKDNPSDELDHTIYTIYEQTGVPIFYNDTIGKEDRGTDVYGNPVYYYEVLNLFYSLTAVNLQGRCSRSKKREDLLRGAIFVRDRILPLLNKSTYPKSFYLVDTIWTSASTTVTTYSGLKTTAIGQMNNLASMSEQQLSNLATTIAGTEISTYLRAFFEEEFTEFYSISNSVNKGNMYEKAITPYSTPPVAGTGEEYGFIVVTPIASPSYLTPSQSNDVKSYILAVLLQNEADFRAKYANAPYVLKKYAIMKAILSQI